MFCRLFGGTRWTGLLSGHNTYSNDQSNHDPVFMGRHAVAAYQTNGASRNQALRGVPVENEGGPGTALGHWRESVFGGELMTGRLNHGYVPMSATTIESLEDIGFDVDVSLADPFILPGMPGNLQAAADTENVDSEKMGADFFVPPTVTIIDPELGTGSEVETDSIVGIPSQYQPEV